MAEGKEVHVHHYDEEWSGGRSKSKTGTNAYGSEVQQMPGRTRTRNRRFELDRQQAPSRSRIRSSG
jgi:hypothetical protein